ncbi:MAG: hypothetical protein K0R29_2878 [Pseudobdellovibrio sp.]|nr:hypothetical protein [Pseudobdellovibrio sp.]
MRMMKRFAIGLGVIFPAVWLFVGCTIQNTPSLLTADSSADTNRTKLLNDVPFAYDLALDTISYNSCVGIGLTASGIHGLKIGANEGFTEQNDSGSVKAGLKLRTDFLQYVAKNISPAYPNTTVVPSQIQYLLENSTRNKELYIQYAVRDKGNLLTVLDVIQGTGSPTINRDGFYENQLLSLDPVLTAVTKNVVFGPNKTVTSEGPRVYNLGSAGSPDPIEASFSFSHAIDESYPATQGVDDGLGAGEEYSDRARQRFNSTQNILTVTFGNPTDVSSSDTSDSSGLNAPRRPTASVLTKAYGRAYELSFKSKSPSIPSQRRNILNNVVEKDLETGNLSPGGSSWTCENYLIMRPNELNNKKATEAACSEILAADFAHPTLGAELKRKVARIRRHYSETEWAVGVFIRANTQYDPDARLAQPICMVSKATNCYLPTVGILTSDPSRDVGVNYNAAIENNTAECYLSRYSQMGVSYIGNKTGDAARSLGRCPQYASICVRTSTSF